MAPLHFKWPCLLYQSSMNNTCTGTETNAAIMKVIIFTCDKSKCLLWIKWMRYELGEVAHCVWWLLFSNTAVRHRDVSWIQMKQDGLKLWTWVNYLTPLTTFITISFIIGTVTACMVTVNHCHHHRQRLSSSASARQLNSPLTMCECRTVWVWTALILIWGQAELRVARFIQTQCVHTAVRNGWHCRYESIWVTIKPRPAFHRAVL